MQPDDTRSYMPGSRSFAPGSYTPTPAYPVSGPPASPPVGEYPTAPYALPAQQPKRRRPGAGVVILIVMLGVLAVTVGYFALERFGVVGGPSAADAEDACRNAIESQAQKNITDANTTTDVAAVTVVEVNTQKAVKVGDGWRVNGEVRFNIVSLLGNTPSTVFLTCNATAEHGEVVTSVTKR
jgi:hypothetical protein